MKTDIQLQRDVLTELAWEPSVNSSQIGVEVKPARYYSGARTGPKIRSRWSSKTAGSPLSGTVHSWSERDAARSSAWSTPGVRNVSDSLDIVY